MAAPDQPPAAPEVKTRRVHYISGFDPRGARYYHRLYEEEATKQSRLNGAKIKVGARKKIGPQVSSWTIEADWNGASVLTEYEFMSWDDVVRQNWDEHLLVLLGRGALFYLEYYSSGFFQRARNLAKGPFYTSSLPLFYFLLCVLVLASMAWTAMAVTSAVGGNFYAGLAVALIAVRILGGWARRWAERLGVVWIMRTCIFILAWGRRPLPEVEARVEEMADWIRQKQETEPVDEILLIGHSIGSIVAVAVLARRLEKSGTRIVESPIHLLTLGECLPYLSLVPTALAFRRDMQTLGDHEAVRWTDATAPPDPLCFFQVDPLRASGLTPRFENRPKLTIIRPFKMFSAPTYKKMRLNKLRLHFQYLMASELQADYDYFRITAGPRRLS